MTPPRNGSEEAALVGVTTGVEVGIAVVGVTSGATGVAVGCDAGGAVVGVELAVVGVELEQARAARRSKRRSGGRRNLP